MDELGLYDACVLYPAPLRDLLIRLVLAGACDARWTGRIHGEWTRNLLAERPDLVAEKLARTRGQMNLHAPRAMVSGYERLIGGLSLPDPDDRHALAAAVRAAAGRDRDVQPARLSRRRVRRQRPTYPPRRRPIMRLM